MSMPILPFAVWASGTNQNSIPANDNSLRNQILNGLVISDSTDAQPVSPSEGEIYIITGSATGAQWAAFDEFDLAIYSGGTWYAFAPSDGVVVNLAGALMAWDGDSYEAVGGGGGGMTNPMTTDGDVIYGGASGTPTRLAAGSDGDVLTLASGVPTWASGGGGSLTNWTEAANSSAPNGTVPVVSFIATNAATNVDAVLSPKGTGSFLAQVPDATVAGGNKRGTRSVDLQMARTNANQVTEGNNAFAAGSNNRVQSTATNGVAIGASNDVVAIQGVALGNMNTIASGGTGGFAAGVSNNVSSAAGTANGASNTVSGTAAHAAGTSNVASGDRGMAFGYRSSNRGIASMAFASGGYFNVVADAQMRVFNLNRITANATPSVATTSGAAPSTSNQIVLPNNSSFLVKGYVLARQAATSDTKSWEFIAHILRGGNAAATAMVAACTPVVVADSGAGASAWTLSVTADTTSGCLSIGITGEAAKTIKWDVTAIATEISES